MTYAFMPDNVWTKVNAPGYLGQAHLIILNISKADALYWFGVQVLLETFLHLMEAAEQ